jgi:hypothetical protein
MSTSPSSEPTAPVPLPVTAVTCTEDRAHVERTAILELRPGTQQLRLGPVSATAVDRTLHAELTAGFPATVLDVRIVRAWTPRGPGPAEDDSPLRRRVTALEKERPVLEQRRDRLAARGDALGRLAADLLREIGEGAGFGEAERERWARELDRVDEERERRPSSCARWRRGCGPSPTSCARRSRLSPTRRRSPPSWSGMSS